MALSLVHPSSAQPSNGLKHDMSPTWCSPGEGDGKPDSDWLNPRGLVQRVAAWGVGPEE